MTVKQLFETYVYAEILSSVDLLPFVIAAFKRRTQQTAMDLNEPRALKKRLVEGEGLTTKNAATRRGVQQADEEAIRQTYR
ncbi:hypothetical protein ACP3TY_28305 [Pseudomonas rustica]|uniref:hypothetical protein n=1 Tax=Pseudomonas rustica TaxID=2827099 RepID=UPI003CE9F94F